MNTMGQYPQAGAAFSAEKNQAAAGMRNYRNDIWQKLFELRQKGMKQAERGNAKDRRMQMLSAGLGAGASLAPMAFPGQQGTSQTSASLIDNVPPQMMMPLQPFPDPYRQRTFNV